MESQVLKEIEYLQDRIIRNPETALNTVEQLSCVSVMLPIVEGLPNYVKKIGMTDSEAKISLTIALTQFAYVFPVAYEYDNLIL